MIIDIRSSSGRNYHRAASTTVIIKYMIADQFYRIFHQKKKKMEIRRKKPNEATTYVCVCAGLCIAYINGFRDKPVNRKEYIENERKTESKLAILMITAQRIDYSVCCVSYASNIILVFHINSYI